MLYITYDATKHQDGAGAQLLRIVSAYLLSRYYNIGYIHTPLATISNFGLSYLEQKKEDTAQIERYNTLINFQSDIDRSDIHETIHLNSVNDTIIHDYKQQTMDKHVLLNVVYPIFGINNNPSILNATNHIHLNWLTNMATKPKIHIGIHIRRGDILLIEKEIRYLPNSYYINIMKELQLILSNIPFEFHIYTENVSKPILFTSDFRSDLNGVHAVLEPETYEEFNEFTNIVWHINTDPIDTFIELCNSDILVISKSAYSYLAAVLTKQAIVIYPPKSHHPPKHTWIDMTHMNALYNNRDSINKHCHTILNIQPPIRYISGGALGDFIHQLGIIDGIYRQTGVKGQLYISHSARATDQFPFGLEQAYNDTYKLISSQPYIESYHIHTNQPYDINLSSWVSNQPLYRNNWRDIFLAEYKTNWCVDKYLEIVHDVKYTDCIFISSSIKRFNYSINYNELCNSLPSKPIFITTVKAEYEHFKRTTGLDLDCIYFESLYDFYVAINSCKLFIGNLSSPTTIAQATMKTRITILQPNYNDPDNIHMRDLDISWPNCIFIYTSNDLYKVNDFIKSII